MSSFQKTSAAVFKSMRPAHWIKNFLIFIPAVFAGTIFYSDNLRAGIIGFLAFSLVSSSIYIINDLFDIQKDKLHPVKKHRPIASGKIGVALAVALAAILFFASVLLNMFMLPASAVIVLLCYFVLNLSYSAGLKNIPILDLVILASGFVLRVVYGAILTGTPISNWLYLVIIFFSFYLGLGKRRNELTMNMSKSRDVLKYYSLNFLDKNMLVCMALTIVFYSLWCLEVASKTIHTINLIFTVPLVIIIYMRYSMNLEKGEYGDPTEIVIKDKVLISLILFYCAIMIFALYGYHV